jgi:DNA-binding LacI/PurR family transcriptional regulator/DNA-binding transcriptional regulator YhcF (GntR family)
MSQQRVLFGKNIVPHHMLNYAEQVYDILVGEIELGRWKVNERLPGVINLAKELNFGTKTIQTAYDRLKSEGYVRTLGYRGTFLKSIHPRSKKKTSEKIGVLVSADQTGDPLILWYEHVILLGARRQGLVTEVKVLPPGIQVPTVNHRNTLFGADCSGIISLTPFRPARRYGEQSDDLPLVFLVPPYESCAPKVSADVREAYYELTCRVIRAGHRHIVFSEDSIEPDPRQTEMHLQGFLAAMKEHGLTADERLMQEARKVDNSDLATVSAYLRRLEEHPAKTRPTAVVAGSLGRAMALLRVAPLQKVRIPGDISVVSIGTDETGGCKITGMLPDFDHMVDTCLGMLERQRKHGRSDYTGVDIRMHFVPGQTLRDLAGNGAATENAPNLNHDPGTLSRVVHYREGANFR